MVYSNNGNLYYHQGNISLRRTIRCVVLKSIGFITNAVEKDI